jgi:hypothetical protein
MHGKGFQERFRSKKAPPPAEQQKSATPVRPRTKRLMGAPLEFVADVCRLTEGRATLVVGLEICRRVHVCSSRTVTLPSGELAELGIDRRRKREALVKLQSAGLIEVENKPGRTAQITLTWQPS